MNGAEQALRKDPCCKLNSVVVDLGWRRRTGVIDVAIRSFATSGKKEHEKKKIPGSGENISMFGTMIPQVR